MIVGRLAANCKEHVRCERDRLSSTTVSTTLSCHDAQRYSLSTPDNFGPSLLRRADMSTTLCMFLCICGHCNIAAERMQELGRDAAGGNAMLLFGKCRGWPMIRWCALSEPVRLPFRPPHAFRTSATYAFRTDCLQVSTLTRPCQAQSSFPVSAVQTSPNTHNCACCGRLFTCLELSRWQSVQSLTMSNFFPSLQAFAKVTAYINPHANC